jgi:putative nucleotidyltransferase with HDIG domain
VQQIIENSAREFDQSSLSLVSLFNDPFGIHGISHAKRVYVLIALLAELEKLEEDEKELLKLAALYHDIGRKGDGGCIKHGKYSVDMIVEYNLVQINNEQLNILKFIIENHCIDDADAIATIESYNFINEKRVKYLFDIFKDADALDRVRTDDLDTSYLRTASARRSVVIAYDLLELYE